MKYAMTMFMNQYDNKTDKFMKFDSWDKLRRLLFELSTLPCKNKKDALLISPALYERDSTRSNKAVVGWAGWCCVDVDNIPDGEDIEILLNKKLAHTYRLVYSTASSTAENPKVRVVFRFNRQVDASEIKALWFAINSMMGNLVDQQTKDLSRMFFVPAEYEGADNFIFERGSEDLNVDAIMEQYPYVESTGNSFLDNLTPEMREAVLEYRRNQLTNTDVRWSSYKDCPFWPRSTAMQYMTVQGEGWYRLMYKIMIGIAFKATEAQYPITASQIAQLCKEFDLETGNWYENRPFEVEANSALAFVLANGNP